MKPFILFLLSVLSLSLSAHEANDVPIFAIFKSKNCRSLRFFITVGNTTMPLDDK